MVLLSPKIQRTLTRLFLHHFVTLSRIFMTHVDISPPLLDKSLFVTNIPLASIKIRKEKCSNYQKAFKGHLFERPRMKRIYAVPEEPDFRFILLKEEITSPDGAASLLPTDLLQFNEKEGGVFGSYTMHLGYEDMSADEVLTRLLPDKSEVPSSFEQVGHLAHLNLRDDMLEFKHVIGQVILDKNPKLRTIVNKMGNIETEYRTFPMEVLAGDEDFNVVIKESGATFKFNFKDVYWNSRLGTEHGRMVNSIMQAHSRSHSLPSKNVTAKNSMKSSLGKRSRTLEVADVRSEHIDVLPVIADMMGGVGPFSIPLGKSGCFEVHCNDLNPASYEYMMSNARSNKCAQPFLSCYNMDGRDFVVKLLHSGKRIAHVLMNLPQSATDFLDVFIGYNNKILQGVGETQPREHLPFIHVYAFSKCVDTQLTAVADIAARCAGVMQCPVEDLGSQNIVDATSTAIEKNFVTLMKNQVISGDLPHCFGHVVRNVSPKKVMVCLSFQLPESVARNFKVQQESKA